MAFLQLMVSRRRAFLLRSFSAFSNANPKTKHSSIFLLAVDSKLRKKLKKKANSPRVKPIPNPLQPRAVPHFDAVLRRDADFRFLDRARSFLSRYPGRSLPLPLAGKLHRELGFPRGRKVSRSASLHPLLFHITPSPNPSLSFTPLMNSLLTEEIAIANAAEPARIATVRKLLMMSAGRRIALSKLYHVRRAFGFPDDLRDRVLDYPEFFSVVVEPDDGRHVLELVGWDPDLAVSALEREFVGDDQHVRSLFRYPIAHGKSLGLDEEGERRLHMATTFPLVSPYSDGWKWDPWTVEAEKYRVGLVHEFLSLTLEKRAMIHHIVEFKEEFKLTKHTYRILAKQPRAFYLAGTEMNWAVFLRDSYSKDGELIEKDPQVVFEEKLRRFASMKAE